LSGEVRWGQIVVFELHADIGLDLGAVGALDSFGGGGGGE